MGYPGQIPGIGGPWTPPINGGGGPLPMPSGGPMPMRPPMGGRQPMGGGIPDSSNVAIPGTEGPMAPRMRGPAWMQKIANGANRFATGLAGGQPGQQVPPQVMQATLGALLAGSGPYQKGTRGLLQPFGEAMLAGGQARAQFDENEMRKKIVEAQLAQMQQPKPVAPDEILARMKALGFPMTIEGFEAYNRAKGSENPVSDQLAAIQAQLAIEQRRDEIDRRRREDAANAETQRRQRVTTGNALRRSIKQTGDIAALVEGLEGSFLGAGIPAANWRRTAAGAWSGLAGAVGGDTSKINEEIGKFDKLKKGLNDQLINLMATGNLGEGTNSKLQQYKDSLANEETSPPAIMSIQAGVAEALLEEADVQGVDVENRDQIEANIERWRQYETGQPSAPAGGAAFATEAEAQAAAAAGRLKPGDRITVGGVSGVWQ